MQADHEKLWFRTQNLHLKRLGPVYEVCVQDALGNVTETAAIKSLTLPGSLPVFVALREVPFPLLAGHIVQLTCISCQRRVAVPAMAVLGFSTLLWARF